MNLTELRARVREDLQDEDALNYRWTDDQINGEIERVVREFSLFLPLEQQTDLATTAGSRDIDISSLSQSLKIFSLEFPLDYHPPSFQKFEVYMDTLTMEDEGNGDNARIRWGKQHTVDASSSTIPLEYDEVIVLGTTGYLATSASVYTVDRATIAGRHATINFGKWGKERLDRYEQQLNSLRRKKVAVSDLIVTSNL